MPIYAYRCANCGLQQDVMQKMSDVPLNTCPDCGKATFFKQVTAASFQLKGSGYYVTDFKGGAKRPDAQPEAKNDNTSTTSVPAAGSTPNPATSGAV